MQELSSTRTTIHELAADELERTLPIYTSNPEFVQQQEGSEGEPGRYDLARWQRDWSIAQYMPGRHLLVACLKDEQQTPIGLVDYLEQSDDDYPYLGALIIHRDYQRQGFATEIFQTLIAFFDTTYYWPLLRATTTSGASFLGHLGFQPVIQPSEERQDEYHPQRVQLFEYVIAH